MRRIANPQAGELKTDVRDAPIIAEAAGSMPQKLRSLRLADEPLGELTVLCGFDGDLAAQITQTSAPIRGPLARSIRRWKGYWDRASTIRLCSVCLSDSPRPVSSPQPAKKHWPTASPNSHLAWAKALAIEIVQALSEQAVIVPGT
ncbi:transposase [Paraburkholderia sp. BL25I1N1]|nr:transposase [Paraburkholderia sp. BL25I1N1]